MLEFEKIAERRILEAIGRGEFDDLPGKGRPLDLDDDTLIPAEMRLAFRILRNAGYVPEEVTLRRQISDLQSVIVDPPDASEKLRALKRLDFLRAELAAKRGHESVSDMKAEYRRKLVHKISARLPAEYAD
jgi:hypothetical protein